MIVNGYTAEAVETGVVISYRCDNRFVAARAYPSVSVGISIAECTIAYGEI